MATTITLRGKNQGDFATVADAMAFGIELEDQHNKEIGALKEQIRALEKAAEDVPWYQDVADAIDRFKLFRRGVIVTYMGLMAVVVNHCLTVAVLSIPLAGLVSALGLAFAPIMAKYMEGSRK